MDCYEIKQGMIFFVEDMSSSENVLFKGEHLPKKRRPWIVVSNDKNNMYSPNVSMVPIFTRSQTTIPTQVYFKHGDRDQVACCEQVNTIPKVDIDVRGYVGVVSKDVWNKIQMALAIQFGIPASNTDFGQVIMNNVLKTLDFESIITNKLLDIIRQGFDIDFKTSDNSAPANTNPIPSSTTTNITPSDTSTTSNIVSAETTTPNTLDEENKTNTKTSETTEPTVRKRRAYKPRGTNMTLEDCLEFYTDADTLTIQELYEKWKRYGITENKLEVSKRKYSIKQRLKKAGLLD